MSPILTSLVARDLLVSYGERIVLDGVDLVAAPGERIGLVGENGSGKSTLLRVLAGVRAPDAGTVQVPGDLAYLPQEPPFEESDTVGDVLRQALEPLHAAVADIERLGEQLTGDPATAQEFARVLEWAEQHEAWDADRRAKVAAERLGVAGVPDDRAISALSGGQRTRLAMAAIITRRPVCVLLDEPTNHLDDAAMELLEEFATGLPGVVVAASHDRTFLDAVCTAIIDLDPSEYGSDGRGGNRYGGGFERYLIATADARRRWEEIYVEQQAELSELRQATRIGTSSVAHNRGPTDNDKFIHKFKGANVERTVARRIRNAEQRLERAEREQVSKPPAQLRFRGTLTEATNASSLAVSIRGLDVPGRVQVDRFDLHHGERLLVTGANGSGKSSLLLVLAGLLPAERGDVRVAASRIGLLEQDVRFEQPDRTARETYDNALGDRAPALTSLGLFPPRETGKPVGVLSVGQRRRLALAILIGRRPDLVLLDEPTNHISLALATELEQALRLSPGTAIVTSHDRWLRRDWDGRTYAL